MNTACAGWIGGERILGHIGYYIIYFRDLITSGGHHMVAVKVAHHVRKYQCERSIPPSGNRIRTMTMYAPSQGGINAWDRENDNHYAWQNGRNAAPARCRLRVCFDKRGRAGRDASPAARDLEAFKTAITVGLNSGASPWANKVFAELHAHYRTKS